MTPTELARRVGLTAPAVTALIDRLEAQKLARRKENPDDRRSILVEYVPQPAKLVGPLYHAQNSLHKALSAMSATERHGILRFLTNVSDAMEEAAGFFRPLIT